MFEQSMLLDHATGKKTGALAASLTAQTLGIGVLILLPLIYNDRLPLTHSWMSPPLEMPRLSRPPEPVQTRATPQPARPILTTDHVFRAPALTPRTVLMNDSAPAAFDMPALSIDAQAGPPGPIIDGAQSIIRHVEVPPPSVKPAATVKSAPKPIQVSGGVQAAKIIKRVMPVYPPLARQARVQGTVRLVGVIAKDGTIQQLQLVSGHPLLVNAALDAVRQWVYSPTMLSGQPVEVIAPIDVIFTLSQ